MSFKEGRVKKNEHQDWWEVEGVLLEQESEIQVEIQGHWLKAKVKYDDREGLYLWLWLRKEPSPYTGNPAATLKIHGDMKMRIPVGGEPAPAA